jgi:hypothetical protein
MPDLRTGGFGQRGGGFVADRGGFVAPGGGFAAAGAVVAGPPPPAWTVDATKGWAMPSGTAEWTAFLASLGLGISPPTHDWDFQELAGNAVDSISGVALVPTTAPVQGQVVAGWSRLAVRLAAGVGNKMLQAAFGNSATTTFNALLVKRYNAAPTAAGQVQMTFGGNNDLSLTTGAVLGVQADRFRQSANIQELPTAVGVTDQIAWVHHDVTNTLARIANLLEILSPAFGVTAGGTSLSVGAAAGTTTAPIDALKLVVWLGAPGEWGAGAAAATIAKAIMAGMTGSASPWTPV